MKEIKKIKKTSLANVFAWMYSLAGFFISISIAIAGLIDILRYKELSGEFIIAIIANMAIGFLISIVIGMFVGAFGWAEGYVLAMFYNMFTRKFEGIKIHLKDTDSKEKYLNEKEEYLEEKGKYLEEKKEFVKELETSEIIDGKKEGYLVDDNNDIKS